MSKRAEEAALKALPPRWRKTKDGKGEIDSVLPVRKAYIRAYEQAEKDIISIIESRISEIQGDAQPRPALKAELMELIDKIEDSPMTIQEKTEIPFGAYDSELKGWEYTIPEGMEAIIENGKVIVRQRETEDERIRKFLIDILSSGVWRTEWPFSPVDCVAYLEKQKEQKQEVKDPFDDEQFWRGYEAGKNDAMRMSEMVLYRQSWYMEGYHDGEFNMEPKWTVKAEKGGRRYYENPNYGKPLEQKEQKPAWSEEDELHRKSIISTIEMCMKDNDSAGYVLGYYDSDIAWLKSLSERFDLESKQEWSEADEGMLNCIIATLCDESHGGRETNDKMVTWLDNRLKSLRPSTSDYKVGDKISWKGKVYTIDKVVCYDNRFEIIDRAKQDLLDKTNIADSPDEMAALYNFLFRCWQMGWLKKYEDNANEDNT